MPHHFRAGGRDLLAQLEVLIDRIRVHGVQWRGRTTLEFREHGGGRHRTQPPSQSALRLRRSGDGDGGDDSAVAAAATAHLELRIYVEAYSADADDMLR